MTCMKLKKIMSFNDFGTELASKLVLEDLFYKAEALYQHCAIAAIVENAIYHCYVERAYKYRPVKVLQFETPHQQCVIFLDSKRDECAILFPSGKAFSQGFIWLNESFSCHPIAMWMNKVNTIAWGCSLECKRRTLSQLQLITSLQFV